MRPTAVLAASLATALLASAAVAQGAVPCLGHPAGSLAALGEPLEDTTRSYADGAVRVLVVSLDEPAGCGVFPAVLFPDPEVGFRACRVILPLADGLGYAGLAFGPGEARYDPAAGLVVPMTAQVPAGGDAVRAQAVAVLVNQATGEVSLR